MRFKKRDVIHVIDDKHRIMEFYGSDVADLIISRAREVGMNGTLDVRFVIEPVFPLRPGELCPNCYSNDYYLKGVKIIETLRPSEDDL